jgi:serine acetyltransferase
MKLKNIYRVIRLALHRIYWCVKKGFPLRMVLCDVPFEDIPASTHFAHPYGITIAKGTIMGERCVFASNVTIGTRRPFFGARPEPPALIGNDVFFGAGCVVLGGIVITDRTIIGANTVMKG